MLRLADKKVAKIAATPGPNDDPKWSLDGTQIAYLTANGSKYSSLYRAKNRGGGERRWNAAHTDDGFR